MNELRQQPILDGKAVVVTGAGAGLGRAYAEHAAAEGARVVVNDIVGERADEVAESIRSAGGSAVSSRHSVASWTSAEALVGLCQREFGRLDGLVNNAGVISIHDPGDETEESIREVLEVNLMGAIFVGTHAIRAMGAAHGGSIVNATSSAQMGIRQLAVYGATKGALASLTYSWALDLAASNIRVNAYAPVASTQMTARSPIPVAGVPTAGENAAVVSYLLSESASGITGQVVQRLATELIVMAHPDFTDQRVAAEVWDTKTVIAALDPLLRGRMVPVGDPRMR